MFCQPSLNQFTVVNLQVVKDEIDFADLSLVRDGRDHVDSVLLGCLA